MFNLLIIGDKYVLDIYNIVTADMETHYLEERLLHGGGTLHRSAIIVLICHHTQK